MTHGPSRSGPQGVRQRFRDDQLEASVDIFSGITLSLQQELAINTSATSELLEPNTGTCPDQPEAGPFERRHDLDALRAIAMLLGIALHAALSFSTVPWMVSDSQTSDSFKITLHVPAQVMMLLDLPRGEPFFCANR